MKKCQKKSKQKKNLDQKQQDNLEKPDLREKLNPQDKMVNSEDITKITRRKPIRDHFQKECLVCKKVFDVRYSELVRKYCSQKCYFSVAGDFLRGKRNLRSSSNNIHQWRDPLIRKRRSIGISKSLLQGRDREEIFKSMILEIAAYPTVTIPQLAQKFNISITLVDLWMKKWAKYSIRVLLKKNGKESGRQSQLISKKKVDQMLVLSEQGLGVDRIGQELGVHGTTVMSYLKSLLGVREYVKRHSMRKYVEGWGKHYYRKNGRIFQSYGEERVSKILNSLSINYKMHKSLKIGSKSFYPDFILNTSKIIEYAGMMDWDVYRRGVIRKKKIYTRAKISCLWVFPEDFSSDCAREKIKSFLKETVDAD